MLKYSSFLNTSRVQRALSRVAISATLLLVLAATATLNAGVLRSGQRLEIPDQFSLTKTTLTYEISPGFNKTIVLTVIDVAATERANREAPGAFFKHREEVASVANEPSIPAVRTLTNVLRQSAAVWRASKFMKRGSWVRLP